MTITLTKTQVETMAWTRDEDAKVAQTRAYYADLVVKMDITERALKGHETAAQAAQEVAHKLVPDDQFEDAQRLVEYLYGRRPYKMKVLAIAPYEGYHDQMGNYYHISLPYGVAFNESYRSAGWLFDPEHEWVRAWTAETVKSEYKALLMDVIEGKPVRLAVTYWDGADGKGEEEEECFVATLEAIDPPQPKESK